MTIWTTERINWLRDNYPTYGLKYCAKFLNLTSPSIRAKASKLSLKQDRTSAFFMEWQQRAAQSKVGKKGKVHTPETRTLMSKKAIAAWNDPSSAARRIKLSHGTSDFWKKNGHPRGSLGMVHTPETRALMSRKAIASRNDPSSRHHSSELRQLRSERMSNMRQSMPAENAYSRSKYGKRADLENRFFRSSWEANYARYLNWMLGRGEIHSWAYEAKTFYFKNDGIRSYLPDFEIIDQAGSQPRYVEIKGWMDCKSVKKLELMGTHYPEIRLEIIGEKEYRQLENMSGIPGWERRYTPQDRLRGPQTEICVEGIPTPPPRSTEAVAGLPNAKKCC